MKIKTIYLDMDGVLCNFEKRYTQLFQRTPKEARDTKEFSPDWKAFIETEQFKSLDWFEGAHKLLFFVNSIKGVQVEILSSSGGYKFHDKVREQKIHWLRERGIEYKANIVSGRKLKAAYASSSSILVDDTEDVIDDFNNALGHGILHRDADETISKIKSIMNLD